MLKYLKKAKIKIKKLLLMSREYFQEYFFGSNSKMITFRGAFSSILLIFNGLQFFGGFTVNTNLIAFDAMVNSLMGGIIVTAFAVLPICFADKLKISVIKRGGIYRGKKEFLNEALIKHLKGALDIIVNKEKAENEVYLREQLQILHLLFMRGNKKNDTHVISNRALSSSTEDSAPILSRIAELSNYHIEQLTLNDSPTRDKLTYHFLLFAYKDVSLRRRQDTECAETCKILNKVLPKDLTMLALSYAFESDKKYTLPVSRELRSKELKSFLEENYAKDEVSLTSAVRLKPIKAKSKRK